MSSITEESFAGTPENFRNIAQMYTDQITLLRLTTNAIEIVLAQLKGGSMLFDVSKDPLSNIPEREAIIAVQARIVDVMILIGLGQIIDMEELQEYAQILLELFNEMDMPGKLQASTIKDQTLRDLEKEWLKSNNMTHVQAIFQCAVAGITSAGEYCGVAIAPLPSF